LQGERKIIADFLQLIKREDVFFDVGANTGLYACFAGQIIDGNVIAFEPHPGNIQRLEENAELNELDIQCHSVALSNESGTAQLKVAGGEGEAGAGTHAFSTRDHTNSIEIEKDRGDGLIEREDVPSPTVLKIDVEGAEQQVLEGLQNSLKKDNCHTVYCEVHPNRLDDLGDSTDELHSLLEECGFKIKIIERRSPQYFIKAEKEF
jgi:FkbM family methyltransferase